MAKGITPAMDTIIKRLYLWGALLMVSAVCTRCGSAPKPLDAAAVADTVQAFASLPTKLDSAYAVRKAALDSLNNEIVIRLSPALQRAVLADAEQKAAYTRLLDTHASLQQGTAQTSLQCREQLQAVSVFLAELKANQLRADTARLRWQELHRLLQDLLSEGQKLEVAEANWRKDFEQFLQTAERGTQPPA